MVKRRRHSAPEIIAKLRQADEMAAEGRLQSDIARSLGVSVMTYHRWRHGRPALEGAKVAERREHRSKDPATKAENVARLDELQLENSRLRRLVTDLLLEKVRLEEILKTADPVA
ncbi:MAG: transposase [Hyphomicrobiales bacterium]|nr:transposase [Hyphomicrobiales bacterium]